MALTHILLESITVEDLQQLINGKSTESRYIDYKKGTYSEPQDKTKRDEVHTEFLKDVSSFANSDGGDIVIGMTETNGVPDGFFPFQGNADEERLRLEQIARSGLKPQIFNLQTRQIPYQSGHIIIIRIPRSYHSPHQISFNNHNRYYIRANNGKYEPDVNSLRYLFNSTMQFEHQVRSWRNERIDKINSKRTPVILDSNRAILAIHLIPYSFTDPNTRLDLTKIESNKKHFIPQNDRIIDKDLTHYYCDQSFYNFDGYLFYTNHKGKNKMQRAYTQIFRSGAIESVSSISKEIPHQTDSTKLESVISTDLIQNFITHCSHDYATGLSKLGITAPVVMSISLLAIKNCVIRKNYSCNSTSALIPQEENLIFTEIILPHPHIDKIEHTKLLKPLLEHLANTIGLSYC